VQSRVRDGAARGRCLGKYAGFNHAVFGGLKLPAVVVMMVMVMVMVVVVVVVVMAMVMASTSEIRVVACHRCLCPSVSHYQTPRERPGRKCHTNAN
jgi:hypothetical protein